MSTPVRWGILSTAGINRSFVPGVHATDGNELLAVSSRSLEPAQAAAQSWGAARAYGSYHELLADADIDAVYVPLPNHLHAEWTIRALEAGKHVLCEKPLALSVEEVDAIDAAARGADRLVLEAFMYRHAPRWLRAVQLVTDGAIGEPQLIRAGVAYRVPGDKDDNVRFAYRPAQGGGVLWDMGCYATDMARELAGRGPTEVFATATTRPGCLAETSVSGVLRFEGGLSAPFFTSYDYPNPAAQVEIIGTGGWISLPGTGLHGEPDTRLWLFNQGDELYQDGLEPVEERFERVDPYALEIADLAAAIRGRAPLRWTLAHSRANVATLAALHTSLRQRRTVPIAP